MKKHLIVIGIIVLLLSVGLSGCNESQNKKIGKDISWEITDWDMNTCKFDFTYEVDGRQYQKPETGVCAVSLTIENTGSDRATFIVDFEFTEQEMNKPTTGTSIHVYPKHKPSDSVTGNPNYQSAQKIISINPYDKRTVTATCNPNPKEGISVRYWRYEISYE